MPFNKEIMLETNEGQGEEVKEEGKRIQVLQRAKKEAGRIDACVEDQRGKWKCISIAVDSGACDNVIPPEELPAYEGSITETRA